jgi:C1A family cysteine protease
MKKVITTSISLIILLAIAAHASIKISYQPFAEDISIEFKESPLEDPIGCIYVNDQYITRLTPEEIRSGKKEMKSAKVINKIPNTNHFQFILFIDGFKDEELVRKDQTGNFYFSHTDFTYTGREEISTDIDIFVLLKFAQLRKIRENIKKEGAQWRADFTSVFMLPEEESEKMLGFRPPQVHTGKKSSVPGSGPSPAQAAFDWTNKDGINWMTKVKNQGGCGSCWAFAVVGQVEAVINIVNQDPDPLFDLAEQAMVSDDCPWAGNCDGGNNMLALHFIKSYGLPLEYHHPYLASNGPANPCRNNHFYTYRINSYTQITWDNYDEAAIKAALLEQPLSTAVCVHIDDSCFHAYTGGIYSYPGPPDPLKPIDHGVILVGWNDNEGQNGTWRIKNSWGDDWGEEGYMRAERGQNNYLGWYTFKANYNPQ